MTSNCTLFINTDGTYFRADSPEKCQFAAGNNLLSKEDARAIAEALGRLDFAVPHEDEAIYRRFVHINPENYGRYTYTAPDGQVALIQKDRSYISFKILASYSQQHGEWIDLTQLMPA